MNWGMGKTGSSTLGELSWDFSKMSSTTLFSIALLAVLVILLIVLVVVTIKVLSRGRKEERGEYTERTYTTRDGADESDEDTDEDDEEGSSNDDASGADDEDSDSGRKTKKDKKNKKAEKKKLKEQSRNEYESGDGEDDEDEEEDSEAETTVLTSAKTEKQSDRSGSREDVAAVVEAALQAKAKAAELEARVAREKAEQAAEEAALAAKKASEAEEEARAAARQEDDEEEESVSETSESEVSNDPDHAYASESAQDPDDAEEADSDEDDSDEDLDDGDEFGHTDEIPVARIRRELGEPEQTEQDLMKAKTQIADSDQIIEAVKAARSGKKPAAEADSAFGENAFVVEPETQKTLDTTFDSAFTDPNLRQDYISGQAEDEVSEEGSEAASDVASSDSAFAASEEIPSDSAFAPQASEELVDSAFASPVEEEKGEEVHSLQVAGETITVNPVNAVNIHTVNAAGPVQTTNPEAGINDPSEMSEFLSDNPVPKKEKKKLKKRDVIFAKKFDEDMPRIEGGRFLWYNNQDIETLTKKEDMYFYCHYFDDPAEAVLPLIIEMYDCAFVRTEEIQRIAYGIQYKSMGLREILTAKEDVSFDRSKIKKDPTEQDLLQIRAKWVDYVDNFLQIIVIKAPAHMQEYIREQLYAYGENDVETLLFCPEPEDDEEE